MHETFMRRCFELARLGAGMVSPNPMVGAVLVREGKILAEGFHAKHGGPHAEAALFQGYPEKDLTGCDLYINLEPCSHIKKLTPPCAPEIIARRVSRVILSNIDPNPQVAGSGIKMLEAAGITVITGVLEAEGEELNEIFFHRMRTQKPFITLKAASTLDGKIALNNGESKWITSTEARLDAHHGRLNHDAILIGAETLRRDNPALTVRLPGVQLSKQPYRLILTASGKIPHDVQVLTDEHRHRTFVITHEETRIDVLPPQQVIRLSTLRPFPFEELYQKLASLGIQSLWLEGGANLHTLFLSHKQVTKLQLYLAPKIMGQGLDLFSFNSANIDRLMRLEKMSVSQVGKDIKIEGYL